MPRYPLFDISDDDNDTPRATDLARFDRLDHSDLEGLLDNERVLPADTRRFLRTGVHKIEAYPERFDRERDDYPSLLALVAASTWCLAREFSLCGLRNAQGYSQPCRIWSLCPACSYIQRKRSALDSYLVRFGRTSWRLVTISFQAELGDGIYDEDQVRLCWQAILAAMHRAREEGVIRGAMTRTEMHLEGFLPMRYHPHLHTVVDADSFDRETVAGYVFAYRCPETGDRVTWPVSIHDRPLTNESSFANALSYLGKPLDLVRPYRAAWPVAAENNRRRPRTERRSERVSGRLRGLRQRGSSGPLLGYPAPRCA